MSVNKQTDESMRVRSHSGRKEEESTREELCIRPSQNEMLTEWDGVRRQMHKSATSLQGAGNMPADDLKEDLRLGVSER